MAKPESDLEILEESDTAFDPTTQHLDLNKEEKRRTTALMMAIQAYRELIIKEAAYLKEAADLARRDEGPQLQPATIDAMIEAAFKFDCFIAGDFRLIDDQGEESQDAGVNVSGDSEHERERQGRKIGS